MVFYCRATTTTQGLCGALIDIAFSYFIFCQIVGVIYHW